MLEDARMTPSDPQQPNADRKEGSSDPSAEFVSVKRLAADLGVNAKTLYNFIREGRLPGVRWICGRILIHYPTVLDWFRKGQGAVPRSRSRP